MALVVVVCSDYLEFLVSFPTYFDIFIRISLRCLHAQVEPNQCNAY